MTAKKNQSGSGPRYVIESEYDEAAYEALTEASWRLFKSSQLKTRTYPFMISVSIILAISLIMGLTRNYSTSLILFHVIGIAFILGAIPLSNVTGKKRMCRKAIKEAKAADDFPGHVRMEFMNKDLRAFVRNKSASHIDYQEATCLAALGKWRMLFFGSGAYLINTEVFESKEEIDAFDDFIQEKALFRMVQLKAAQKFI